jgi:T4 RnlA family RNA ligase
MTRLRDIMDELSFLDMAEQGYISIRHHPEYPLAIVNYTAKAQYENIWNLVTLQCRGIVFDYSNDNAIVSRPLKKFFNYGDDGNIGFSLDGPVEVTEKLDGSLICVSDWDGHRIVSSRGSFESDHAKWAEELLGSWLPWKGHTYVFELIHPENRIVVDYGDRKELVLLTIVDNETGQEYHTRRNWPGAVAKKYDFNKLEQVLAEPEIKNAEGFVVYFHKKGNRLKIKFPEYVKLHKIMTNFSELAIWEVLSTGGSLDDWLTNVPDEFYNQVTDTVEDLHWEFDKLQAQIDAVYDSNYDEDKKTFALRVKDLKIAPALFAMHSGKEPDSWIWKQIRPRGDKNDSTIAAERD